MKKEFQYSVHAVKEMARRGIDKAVVDGVLAAPMQKVPGYGDIICYQSNVKFGDKPYLLRIMVDEHKLPPMVVTVYRTGKIEKYWRRT